METADMRKAARVGPEDPVIGTKAERSGVRYATASLVQVKPSCRQVCKAGGSGHPRTVDAAVITTELSLGRGGAGPRRELGGHGLGDKEKGKLASVRGGRVLLGDDYMNSALCIWGVFTRVSRAESEDRDPAKWRQQPRSQPQRQTPGEGSGASFPCRVDPAVGAPANS